jgi:hypothetical protein
MVALREIAYANPATKSVNQEDTNEGSHDSHLGRLISEVSQRQQIIK